MSALKFLAFVKNDEALKLIKLFATTKNYGEDVVIKGNIETAIEKFSDGAKSPEFLVVELSSKEHKAAFNNLDKLANHCEPGTKVIIIGDIDELSFYKELMNIGVHEYLLNPIKLHQLERVTAPKTTDDKKDSKAVEGKKEAKVISLLGTRGGVGTSTIAFNLGKVLSEQNHKTVILDFDPDYGVIPLLFDIEPSRGLVDALEKPERVDALFLDRVMTKINEQLYVIGAEKAIHDAMRVNEKAGQVLVDHLKGKFDYIIADLSRIDSTDICILQHANNIVITELSIPGLRDTMRIYDLINDTLGNRKITLVANKVGVNKKYETSQKDFEAGLRKKLDFVIPFEAEIYGFNNSGETLVQSVPDSKLAKAIKQIAAKFTSGALEEALNDGKASGKGKKAVSLFDKIIPKK